MKRALVRLLAAVGGLVILAAAAAVVVAFVVQQAKSRVPGKTVLEVDLETELVEHVPEDPVAKVLQSDTPTLRDVVDAIDRAAGDKRVVALVANLGAAPLGVAQVQEIRDAVLRFRAKKKPAVAFSETFGEVGPANGPYYLATAFDEIHLQPSGDVGLTGLISEQPFLRGTLEKLGITPRMDHRHEYKNAMNLFTERSFTPAHREATLKVVSSIFSQVVRGIAEGRKLAEADVRALIDRGPFFGQEAVDAKLVDGLGYRDEVYERVKQKAGSGARLLYLSKYLERAGRPHQKGRTIAVIYGLGAVQRGTSEFDPLSGTTTMGSDTVAGAFRAAIDDKDVKAILFRVDSPGGSYVASDAIWRETLRAKRAGKPVVVSMGDVAGSGGYFVAMSADKIVAQPGTITASIGVVGGKMLTAGLWEKVGLSWDEVHTSANATMWTTTHDYSPAEWARFQAWLDRVYADFTTKVAEGRKLPREKVLEIAKGRIWTGEDAKGLGLVDELGGMDVALALAKKAAMIPAGADVKLKVFPAPKEPIQMLLEGSPDSSEDRAMVRAAVRSVAALRPFVRALQRVGLWGPSGALSMPPVEARP